jgi:A/G-specific adenine glycosylase
VNTHKIIQKSDIKLFQTKLLVWFSTNGRNFYWRNKHHSNYQIIISETLLQRTKVETVAKFLPVFLKRYPTWRELGESSQGEIIDFIRPLGLNKQRGLKLFMLAQEIKLRGGIFPKERDQLEEMPMMGQYLCNAFELFILKKRVPLLDVNMARLLERFFGKRNLSDIRYDPYLQNLAYMVVNIKESKRLNWAILDYASLICQSKKPKCNLCVINQNCQYFISQSIP